MLITILPHLFTVVAPLHEIRDVNVEEETVRYFGKGYLVVLRFATGFSHPLTQSAVLGYRRCSVDFLKLECVKWGISITWVSNCQVLRLSSIFVFADKTLCYSV